MRWMAGVLLLIFGAGSGGCTLNDLVARVHPRDAGEGPGDAGSGDAGEGPGDAGMDGGTPTARDEYCARSGPAWIMDPTVKRETCGGHLAARVFKQAVCSRGGIAASASFKTHATSGPASVWSGGFFSSSAGTTIGGSLQVDSSAPGGFNLTGPLSVSGSLLIGGAVEAGSSSVTVGGDMKVEGGVFLDSLAAGALFVPEGRALTVNRGFPGDRIHREPVGSFTPTCPVGSLEDIGALVAQNQPLNHDSLIGLDPAEFEDVSMGHARELSCGRFYLTRIGGSSGGGSAQLSIPMNEKVTLFVGGSVNVDRLEVAVFPGADLDLFVAGDLRVHKQFLVTSNFEPYHVRIYIQGALEVPADPSLEAQFYAPNADLIPVDNLTMEGSLFIQDLDASVPVDLAFDPRILQVESTCTD